MLCDFVLVASLAVFGRYENKKRGQEEVYYGSKSQSNLSISWIVFFGGDETQNHKSINGTHLTQKAVARNARAETLLP